jgi:ABC-type nitrate/sulfonate/bicarbonate transport system substrate-binding protein
MKVARARLALLFSTVVALVSVVAIAAGASTAAPLQTGGKTAGPTIRLIEAGSTDFSSADVFYFADLMKKNGINVQFNLIPDASSALRTVIAGQADLFIGSLPTAILAVVNGGANIKIISANDQASDYVLVAQPGVTMQNLSGKTLAIDSPGSAGHVASEIGLQKSGVDPSILHYVKIGGSSARLTAILAGKVDIAPLHYPQALSALATGKVNLLLNVGKVIGPYLQSGLIASDSFLKNKPLAQRAVNNFINAERWAASNKFKYIAYANAQKLDGGLDTSQEAKVWDYYSDTKFFGINGGICFDNITQFAKLNWTIGSLPKPLPGRKDWLNDTFAKAYLKAHNQKTTAC